mgnify:CR=1 FL=1
MNTQKIPFSIDKMKDAIRYETRGGEEVAKVELFDCCDGVTVACVIGGELEQLHEDGSYYNGGRESFEDLFIIIEKPIEYPCLCWVSQTDSIPTKDDSFAVSVMQNDKRELKTNTRWNYSTPLTDEELAELGLMGAEK